MPPSPAPQVAVGPKYIFLRPDPFGSIDGIVQDLMATHFSYIQATWHLYTLGTMPDGHALTPHIPLMFLLPYMTDPSRQV